MAVAAGSAVPAPQAPAAPRRPRLLWLDNLKGLVITLVVVGHVTGVPEWLKHAIHSFNMPLSFFLSGVLFDAAKYPTLRSFARARANRLLKPFLLYAALSFALYVTVFRLFEPDFDLPGAASSMLLATPATLHITHVTPVWFLTCLFLTELLYLLGARLLGEGPRLLAAAACVVALGTLIPVRLPWSADTACLAVGWFAFGRWLGARVSSSPIPPAWGAAAFAALLAVALLLDLDLDLAKRLQAPGTIALAYALVASLVVAVHRVPGLAPLEFFGRNSLVILGTHNLVLLALRFLFDFVLDVTLAPLVTTTLFASVVMATMVPLVALVNRRARWMAGQ